MNIRFNSIDIENFRSIERAFVELENQGTVIVKGVNEYEDKATSNGSGKSSVFEAIIFALFEETSSGEKDVANRIIDNGYSITLKFEVDNDKYIINRQCSKGGKTSVVVNKNGLDISARNKTDTNKIILQILGINKAIFLDSVFLSQNANTNLASLTPTARKERLEILTNTDFMINSFKEKLKEKQTEYEAECVSNQLKMNKLNGNKETNLKQQADLQLKINEAKQELERLKQLGNIQEIDEQINLKENVEMSTFDKQIEETDKMIQDKEQEIEDLRKLGEENLNKKDELDKQKQEKLNEWNKVDKEIQTRQQTIQFTEQDNKRLDKEIDKIRKSDKCPTCGRKYDDANEEHIQKAIQELEDAKQENNKQIESIKQEIEYHITQKNQIEEDGKKQAVEITKVSAEIEEHRNKVNEKELERRSLNNKKQEILDNKNKCQKEIDTLKSKKEQILKTQTGNIEEFEEMIKKIVSDIEIIDAQLKEAEDLYNKYNDYVSVVKNSIQMVTKEFRTYLLQNSLQYLNKLLAQYSSQLFSNETDVIRIEEDDTKLNIKLGNATYESLSGGEKTRVNIALLLAQKSLANIIGNISCNIIILDEVLGYCDSMAEENVISLLTQELESLESIYMVSHKEIPIGYDAQLIIVKDKRGLSRVANR